MKIESEGAPDFAHAQTEYQTRQDGHNPGCRFQDACRRKVNRLLVDQDGTAIQSELGKRPLDQPESATQDQNGKHEEDREQLDLQLKHVPVDGRITERAKPKRGNVNRKATRSDEEQDEYGQQNEPSPTLAAWPGGTDVNDLAVRIQRNRVAHARLAYAESVKGQRPFARLARPKGREPNATKKPLFPRKKEIEPVGLALRGMIDS